jgi:pimeloyl-ACP methyl ester carboxylesterase
MNGLSRIGLDGVQLAYVDIPGDASPVFLVHGWCCDHSYFEPQIAYFAARGHRVVAVDLRGHGASEPVAGLYTMGAFANDLAALCAALALPRPIVIGHSMGGIVAFDLAVRYPTIPAAIVMIDAAVVVPSTARPAMRLFIDALRGPDYRSVLRDYVGRVLFISTDDPTRKVKILDAMASAPQTMMVAAFQGLVDYDPDEAGARIAVPSLYIAADEPTPRSDMLSLRVLAPNMQFGQTVGSGHFCQLEVPDQVNAMIDRFLIIKDATIR